MSRITDRSSFPIKNFRSTGIHDDATSNTITITDSSVTVDVDLVVQNKNILTEFANVDSAIVTANSTLYSTRSTLFSTNTAIRTLVNENLANTNAEIDLLNTNLTSTNTAIRTLVNENLANTNSRIANFTATGTYAGNLLPDANVTYDLGSNLVRWRDLYLSGNTIVLGNASISSDDGGITLPEGSTISGTGDITLLINDRMQVANVEAYLANTNAEIDLLNTNLTSTNTDIRILVNNNLANTNAEIDLLNTNLTSTNTAIRTLVDNNLANTNAEIDLLNTNLTSTNTDIRTLVNNNLANTNAEIDLLNTNLTSTNTDIRTLVNNNLANTNAEIDLLNTNLTSTNTSIRLLVSDRLQVANADTRFLRKDGTAQQVVGGQVTFSNNIIVSGNLVISGTTTTVNSQEVNIANSILVLNHDLGSGVAPSEDAGLRINRGSAANVNFIWDETNDRWTTESQGLYVGGTTISAGNFLAGTTITNPASGFSNQRGFTYTNSTGKVEIATTANDVAIEVGKNNANDGALIHFRKESTVVGSIGADGGAIYIGNTVGEKFKFHNGTGGSFYPATDNNNDLGASSFRFKDLYLSGNINVGGTVDGRDIASDGSKLDGIESGATADQTASEILTAIKTVDGSGSGLDADLLDGVQGGSYLRSDANDTYTGILTFGDTNTIIYGSDNFPLVQVNSTRAYFGSTSRSKTVLATNSSTGVRAVVSGTEHVIWHDGNDGSGSGLDADLLDGIQGSSFLRSDANDTSTGTIAFGSGTLDPDSYGSYSGGFGTINDGGGWGARGVFVHGGGTGDAAAMAHNGDKLYFGIQDGASTNSMSTWLDVTPSKAISFTGSGLTYNTNNIWHAGNDGSGSGLDADLLDGQQGSYYLNTSTTFGGDVSGTYNAIVVANDSHTHDTRYYTETEADNRFVNVTGDTMTGLLIAEDGIRIGTGDHNTDGRASLTFGEGPTTTDSMYIEYDGENLSGDDNAIIIGSSKAGVGDIMSVTYGGAVKIGTNNVFHDGYHPNADKWTTARTLSLTGEASGSVSWDGSGNASLSVTLSNTALDDQYVDVTGDTMSGQLVIDDGEANPLELKRTSQVGIEFNDTSIGSRYLGVNGGVLRYGGNLNHGLNNIVWHAGNDGSGSGLDADLLDGVQGGSYLRSDADDSFSGTLTSTISAGSTALDLATNDGYAEMRVIRNATADTTNDDGMYIGYANSGSGVTRIYGGGATSGGIVVSGSGVNDVTIAGSTAWHAGNDGSGSGLDADLLDGVQGSSYLRSDQNDTFTGDLQITGLLTATTKSFTIDHPTKEGKKLRYGSLEGPENGVYVRGRLQGTDTIELPEYWTELVHEDSITVQLTANGAFQKLFVKEIKDNKVIVGNGSWFSNKTDCFYIVYGERKDVDKLEVEFDA